MVFFSSKYLHWKTLGKFVRLSTQYIGEYSLRLKRLTALSSTDVHWEYHGIVRIKVSQRIAIGSQRIRSFEGKLKEWVLRIIKWLRFLLTSFFNWGRTWLCCGIQFQNSSSEFYVSFEKVKWVRVLFKALLLLKEEKFEVIPQMFVIGSIRDPLPIDFLIFRLGT